MLHLPPRRPPRPRLTALRLEGWGIPYSTGAHDDLVLIVAGLTANAVRHGQVPGRDFRLRVWPPAGYWHPSPDGPGKTAWAEHTLAP
ncbi:hypothetical protein ACFYXF_21080 [Streptomyces sp. NPDC002680]|uniref:hypothetical protein n=1 Tax=Streptomyces sp. NPDC002680 TaxID=3364659 RepID=UPI00368A4390